MHAIKMSDLRESMASYVFPSRSSTPRHSTSESFMSTSFLSKAKHRSVDSYKIDEYFLGPRELDRHSKWPMMLRMHGSVLPRMILPLLFVGSWTTAVCLFSEHVVNLSIKPSLLNVLGFVVALSLSLRSSTALERYMEGRRAWTTLATSSQNLARCIWVHVKEREDHAQDDLLAKITALNLIKAYAYALKHRLHFEPYTHYPDLHDLVQHLDTFSNEATEMEQPFDSAAASATFSPTSPAQKSRWRAWGQYLGLSWAVSNPRKTIKRASRPLGNLPLEILNCVAGYLEDVMDVGCFGVGPLQAHAFNAVLSMNDVLGTTDRILNTPLPLSYAIAISQLTWVYILILPFQLYEMLKMVAIPGTFFAAYMILGFAYIGQEIENPFGDDVNDLPLDAFCAQLTTDIDIIAASPQQDGSKGASSLFVRSDKNHLLAPVSDDGYAAWREVEVGAVRGALRRRALRSMERGRGGKGGKEEKVVFERNDSGQGV